MKDPIKLQCVVQEKDYVRIAEQLYYKGQLRIDVFQGYRSTAVVLERESVRELSEYLQEFLKEDSVFWRDVLGPMEDLLIEWQTRPCKCTNKLCQRCKIVSLCSQFKATLEES